MCEAFQVWVKAQGGKDAVARRLGVAPGTVHWWIYRQGRPNTENLLALVRLAGGELTVDEIIESTRPFGAPSDSTARKRAAKRKH